MGLRNALLVARRQVGAVREDRYVVFLLGLVIALGVVAVLGARHHAGSEAEQRIVGGRNPGRKSSNYLQGCTICVFCR
ncbi:hypothetical protein [Candidatus Palauibacter sp.]|uniref:hypothetical protein n=1 Tax=Candidatus Palauibacter sp. TaxID=3101350 RepID=UPI003B52F8E9